MNNKVLSLLESVLHDMKALQAELDDPEPLRAEVARALEYRRLKIQEQDERLGYY